jgi:hypothetical protein
MWIWVCVSCVIFKTGISCGFRYGLATSFSKQEFHADLGMRQLRDFQNRNIMWIWVCISGVIFKAGIQHQKK